MLHIQLAAGLLSALGLAVIDLLAYGIPFLMKGPLVFRDCPLYNAAQGGFTWFDWTYGQYLLILSAMLLSLGLTAGGATLFLSQYSGNYVAMLLKAVPLLIALGPLAGSWLLDGPFYFKPPWDYADFCIPRGTEAVCVTALLSGSMALLLWTALRQKKRELTA